MPTEYAPPRPSKEYVRDGINLAILHIKNQRVVWEQTTIPPGPLLDILMKNLEALKEHA